MLAILLVVSASTARAQYVAFGAGGLFPQDQSGDGAGGVGGPALSEFGNSGLLAVDAGIGFLPFLGMGLHYSYSSPELILRRGDAVGSSAVTDLGSHTLTFDARLRTPHFAGVRLYGLVGGGFTRFSVAVKQVVEVPFPGGDPDNVISPVFTMGGGIEKSVAPLLHLKFEVRDYVTPISRDFYGPGGAWHRVAVIGGIVLGR
jgi:hypothetical protein